MPAYCILIYQDFVIKTDGCIYAFTNPGFVDCFLVELHESVYGALSDLQRGKMGQEIVAHKETHEHPVIYGTLQT